MFILPFNQEQATGGTPRAVLALIVLNTLVWFATLAMPANLLFMHYGFIPVRHEVFTVFTSMFLHSGFLHLLGKYVVSVDVR